jgi:hypothetical protein
LITTDEYDPRFPQGPSRLIMPIEAFVPPPASPPVAVTYASEPGRGQMYWLIEKEPLLSVEVEAKLVALR